MACVNRKRESETESGARGEEDGAVKSREKGAERRGTGVQHLLPEARPTVAGILKADAACSSNSELTAPGPPSYFSEGNS